MHKFKALAGLAAAAALAFSAPALANVCGAQYDQMRRDYVSKYNAHQTAYKGFTAEDKILGKRMKDFAAAMAAHGVAYSKLRELGRAVKSAREEWMAASGKVRGHREKSEAAHREFQAANNRFYPVYKKCVVDDKARQWGASSSGSGRGAETKSGYSIGGKASSSGGSQ